MCKKVSLSKTKRAQIMILHKEGFSQWKICKKVSCSKTVVYQVIARFLNVGLYHDKKMSGRLRKTSPRDDNFILDLANSCWVFS